MSSFICFVFITPCLIFQGRAIDALTREPIPYVQIQIEPLGLTIHTDSAGTFTLPAFDLPQKVTIAASRLGYETRVYNDVFTNQTVTLFLLPRAIPIAGVTSTATRLRFKPAPAQPVRVIENEHLEPQGRTDISELLTLAPGVIINDYGNLSTVSLRGATAEQTLVMLDGVRLNLSLNNQVDLTLIPPGTINRIEVVRGGASALYGANPIGGVINLITPPIEQRQIKANLGIGSFGKRYAGLSLMAPGSIDYLLSGSFIRADNRFPFSDTIDSVRVRANADLNRTDVLIKSGVKLSNCQYLSLLCDYRSAERGSPGPVSFPSESARLNDRALLLITGYDLVGPTLSHPESVPARLSLRFYHQRFFQHYHNPSGYFFANDTHLVNRTGVNIAQWFNTRYPGIQLDGVFGFESNYEQAKSTTVKKPARLTGALYLETGVNYAGFSLLPALRYELANNSRTLSDPDSLNSGHHFNSTYGAFSPKAALVISRFQPFSFYLGANRSFRNPTFNEMWWPADAWTKGNPKLLPEWATGFDAGAALRIGRSGLVRTGLFYSRVTNLIQWQPDESFVYQPVNIATATIKGLEFEPSLDFRYIRITGNATYQICRSDTTDLPYRPRCRANLQVSIIPPTAPFSLLPAPFTLTFTFTGRAFSWCWTDQENTAKLPGGYLLDAGLSMRVPVKSFRAVLNLGAQNLLNRRYQTIKDYPLPGRSFYLETAIGM
ncbi:MAG: TonB-dependent receptor [bacterium]